MSYNRLGTFWRGNIMYKRGFTLIELMVVIAIVAILAAVSIGAYKQYALKTKVTRALNTVEIFAHDAVKEFELTNAFPSSQTVNGMDTACTWVPGSAYVNFENITYFTFCSDNNAGYVQYTFRLGGLDGIPTYVEADGGNHTNGNLDQLSYAVRLESDGTYSTECGHYNPAASSDSIPFEYLPASCQCANVATWATGGACS